MKNIITHTAKRIGISQGHLSNIIIGRRRPNPDIALKISRLTKTELEVWLFKTEKNLAVRRQSLSQFKDEEVSA